jgi:hypothetical protein
MEEVRQMLVVRGEDGVEVACTVENTLVYLFKGDDELDHVGVKLEGGRMIVVYELAFVEACIKEELPMLIRFDRPQWAIDRRVNKEAAQIDADAAQLLGGDV